MNVLTAEQFVAQGTTPGQILSIAALHGNTRTGQTLRLAAREVGVMTGRPLSVPRKPKKRKAA